MLRRILIGLLGVVALAGAAMFAAASGWLGRHEGPGAIAGARVAHAAIAARERLQATAARARGVASPRQILFGDLHVHTTFSFDAFTLSLPMVEGSGAHPPADACDFARYCSALDFFSLNDHAEDLTPLHWREEIDAVRACNDIAGDPADPDLVAFLGWEWTQMGVSPADHYGHKNIVLAHTDDARIPTRPIAARGGAVLPTSNFLQRGLAPLVTGSRALDWARYQTERAAVSDCPDGVPVRDLPADCRESAATPELLFAKLDEWGHESLVIPHGTTWGAYTPPGSNWEKQLAAERDPPRQTLIEVYSGHGNSEAYRDFAAVRFDAAGNAECPEATTDYLPGCVRAGQIVGERCREAGWGDDECVRRAADARRRYVEAGGAGHLTVPGAEKESWLDAGQCRDCFLPAFNYRPGGAAQTLLALRDFSGPNQPRRFRFGFIGSSDNHSARPGTGYKEYGITEMTETRRLPGLTSYSDGEATPRSVPVEPDVNPLLLRETERIMSFFFTGGLVAVHADGRNRASIWNALSRREVYGTSGPRILLWFDLLNPPGTAGETLPMGSDVELAGVPVFRVRAVGSFEQKPGCPEDSVRALAPDRLARLCGGECYHPSDARRAITRIEVVRIRPRLRQDEPLAPLIDDPWRSFPCEADAAGCEITFSDVDFPTAGRDTVYYARAIEAPSRAVNDPARGLDRRRAGACD